MRSEVCIRIPFKQNKTGMSNIRCNAGYLAARIKGGWGGTRPAAGGVCMARYGQRKTPGCSWGSLYMTRYREKHPDVAVDYARKKIRAAAGQPLLGVIP